MASQSGTARAMFIDSWVVGVKVYGSRPNRLMERRKSISEVSKRAHLWPALFRGVISCLVIRLASQSCRVERRLVTQRLLGDGSSKVGNRRDNGMSGIPRRYGLENWSKKLRFMVRFRGLVWLVGFYLVGGLWW